MEKNKPEAQKKKFSDKVGVISFYIGLLIAVIFSFLQDQAWTVNVLLGLGLLVGIINITDKEIIPYLIASIALIIAGSASLSILPWEWLRKMLILIVIFVLPGTILGALKAVYAMAANK